MRKPNYKIDTYDFDDAPLASLLGIQEPPFAPDALRQINYIEAYLSDIQPRCQSILAERYYIDRDFMEDYSVFYSRNLFPYGNWCERVHFFTLKPGHLAGKLREIVNIGIKQGEDAYRKACRMFSKDSYLGFTVVKPLKGCPVGRTVLRHYDEDVGNGMRREFPCTRNYKAHVLGVELTVRGLAFQQQDIGVSACATTALWIAIQKARDFEDIGSATPAQITRLASQYSLPFGRSMPSEGLSLDQMCQAIQAMGISPSVVKVSDYETARGYLYSACKSGFAQVLLLQNPVQSDEAHAITVAGMKTRPSDERLFTTVLSDRAADLVALYVHDDRTGPYLRADLRKMGSDTYLDVGYGTDINRRSEPWQLKYILVPMHGKIRLSFDELRSVARNVADRAEAFRDLKTGSARYAKRYAITFETLILRSPVYIEQFIFGQTRLSAAKLNSVRKTLYLSRYVGIVRLRSEYFGSLDVLIDTTSTPRNIHCLTIIAVEGTSAYQKELVRLLAEVYDCPSVV